jgi:hypothetical protein
MEVFRGEGLKIGLKIKIGKCEKINKIRSYSWIIVVSEAGKTKKSIP